MNEPFKKFSTLDESPSVASDSTVTPSPVETEQRTAEEGSELKKCVWAKIQEFEACKVDPKHQTEMEQNAILVTLRELKYYASLKSSSYNKALEDAIERFSRFTLPLSVDYIIQELQKLKTSEPDKQ